MACGNRPEQSQISMEIEETSDILIAYFSHTGNTRMVAEYIQGFLGGDLFEITPVEPYPEDFEACVARAREELENRLMPELEFYLDNLDNYSTVFLGFPIWMSATPMAVLSFLAAHDFTDITIIPFTTRGRGDIGQSVNMIRNALPYSDVLDGFHEINRANFDRAFMLVEEWILEHVIVEGFE